VPAMTSRRKPRQDLDSPWKEALEHFLDPFLALLFPTVHKNIDWRRGYQSLDKELQQITRRARTGKRLADKLFKVWSVNGKEAWLLIHIEVQGQKESGFEERMFVYNYRTFDRYRRPVVSMALLCDDNPTWRPDRFAYNVWGSSHDFRFLTVKLLDYQDQTAALEQNPNPFAPLLIAHLKVLETQESPAERWQWKVRLIKGLYERGLNAESARQLMRLTDWMMQLPDDLERTFRQEIHDFEESRTMPYIPSYERFARQEALLKAVGTLLESKFGEEGKELLPKAEKLSEDKLLAVVRVLGSAEKLSEVKKLLR
jgi:hypothetical protein